MKKSINGKIYDTETAAVIGNWDNDCMYTDFNYVNEILYKTLNGAYFLYGDGGPASKYSESIGSNGRAGGEDIRALDREAAFQFCQRHDLIDAIELELHSWIKMQNGGIEDEKTD